MSAVAPTLTEVEGFLNGRHGSRVSRLHPLEGGFWSSAFAYRVEGHELVLRLGTVREGFEMDRVAMTFDRADLPVPDVREVGEWRDQAYAISARKHGRFLETVRVDQAGVAGVAIERTLAALRAVPAERGAQSSWYPAPQPGRRSTWRRWLNDGLVDDPRRRVNGWRNIIASDPQLDRLFRACQGRIDDLVKTCPERRDLVHGDLLNRNVLITEDASQITAVYSWKCSVRGDFLFDVAWLTFWGAWHPGIAAANLWNRTMNEPTLTAQQRMDAELRHHCYEVRIGASHLGWNAWTGNRDELWSVATRTEDVLERGPLSATRT